jgi:predicted lipid-binding transport protein (Tim44 family)
MKRFVALAVALVAAGSLVAADVADAKRLGGGRSFGTQRSMPNSAAPAPSSPSVSPPGAAANPVMPAQPGNPNLARPAAPAAAGAAAPAAARTGMSRWLAPIAGIAAGLGIAALLSHFGLSETFATFLLIALVVIAGVFLLRLVFARRNAGANTLRYAGASEPAAAVPKSDPAPLSPSAGGARTEPATAAVQPSVAGRYPPGFDPVPFLAQAKAQFARLQAAYDSGDRRALADVMTPEMFVEVAHELDARGMHVPTEVVSLEAAIEDVTTEGDLHWASVRFHGSLREDGATSPQPIDEMWNLVKPVDGSSGWLLAGIRQIETAS